MLEPSRRPHRPAIEALELTGRYAAAGNLSYYPSGERVPARPELRGDREPPITQTDKRDRPRTVRMAHEAATFRELQERLRCKEIWVVGAAAIAAATGAHGEGGSKMRGAGMAAALTASDAELFGSPAWMTEAPAAFRAMFAQGIEGYADDRLADGAGWITFDVASIRCPVTVLHGISDRMVDVIHAHHTAELIPGANLVIFR